MARSDSSKAGGEHCFRYTTAAGEPGGTGASLSALPPSGMELRKEFPLKYLVRGEPWHSFPALAPCKAALFNPGTASPQPGSTPRIPSSKGRRDLLSCAVIFSKAYKTWSDRPSLKLLTKSTRVSARVASVASPPSHPSSSCTASLRKETWARSWGEVSRKTLEAGRKTSRLCKAWANASTAEAAAARADPSRCSKH